MDYKDKKREDLIKELKDLKQQYESLRKSYEEDIESSKTNDEKLKKSEEKFRKAFVTNPDSININRRSDGMYVSINEGFTKIMGYTEEEVIGKTSLELNIWSDPSDRDNVVKGLKAKGQVNNLEAIFKCKDNTLRYGMMSAVVLDLDNVPHILSITRDVTDRKRIEITLKESEKKLKNELKRKRASDLLLKDNQKKLRSIFSAAPVGIGHVVNRVIVEVNDTFCRMTGYNRGELIGQSSEIVYPTREDFEYVGRVKYDMISKGGIGTVETKLKCKDGKLLDVILSFVPLDKKDSSLGITFTVMDITDRRRAEDELIESYRLINTLISNLQGIVYRCRNDKNRTMEFLSDGTQELTGYSPKEIIGNSKISYGHIINQEDRVSIWKKVQEALKEKKHFQFIYRIVTKSGEEKWVWEKGKGLYSKEGKVEVIEGFITDITQQKVIEEALRLSEEKFRSIAENLSDVIFITDSAGIIKYISPASRMFGYNPDDCVGKFFGDFLFEGELEKAMTVFTNALNGKRIDESATLLFKRSDGTNFFAELSSSEYKVGNEAPGLLGLLRDVSEKVTMDNELRKLSRVVDQSPTSILITDLDGIIEYVNPKLCEITGFSYDELIGKTPAILSSGEKSKAEYKALWDTIEAGNDWEGEFHNVKKSGDLYWESAIISPIISATGQITHYLGIKEDITDKKESEQRLIESEKRYSQLFISNPVPAYIYDEDSLAFVEVNDAAVQNYGYSKEEFALMTLKDLRLPKDIPELMESISSSGKVISKSAGMKHVKKDGTVIPVELVSHSLPEKNGRKTRLVMATDITERLKASDQMRIAKDKAEASDKLKTTFLNNISHEVRTPLNGILGFAEIMSQPDLSEKDRKESVLMLSESSHRLLTTITNYMDISLITSGNLSVSIKEFVPGRILRTIYDIYLPRASGKNLQLLLDLPQNEDNILVRTDPEIFRKIISHLVNNAVKFTEQGTISFGYSIRNEENEFFVKDTGIGIGAESLDIIFDRFVKEDRGPSRLSEGSGLGLSIIKGMTGILGLKLHIESEMDVGSTFFLSVPSVNDPEIILSETISHKHTQPGGPASILVAEDDKANFFYLKTLLARETESTLIHASDGKEAIELFKANQNIKLILMDIKMPEMDGLEATRRIKEINKDVPVIAITAYAMSGDEERVIAAGCDGYLSKPISKKSLLNKIAEFVKI